MFGIEEKVLRFLMGRRQKKMAEAQKKQVSAQQVEFLNHFKALLEFVNWMNTKCFTNRAVRKDFWYKVGRGEAVLEKTIRDMMAKYEEDHKAQEKK